jgi:uncharacterized membrane protein
MEEQTNNPMPANEPTPERAPEPVTPTPAQEQPAPQAQPAPAQQPASAPTAAPASAQTNTGMAIVAYILFFIPLLTDAKKDPFVKFHVKQGFMIFAAAVIVWIIQMLLPWSLMFKLSWLFSLLGLAILVLAIIGIVNAANGKQEKLPLIGQYADKFKFLG